jgi:hypothetical protein
MKPSKSNNSTTFLDEFGDKLVQKMASKSERLKNCGNIFNTNQDNSKKIHINYQLVESSHEVKYLRLYLDRSLNFSRHINQSNNSMKHGIPDLNKSIPIAIKSKLRMYQLYIRSMATHAGPA